MPDVQSSSRALLEATIESIHRHGLAGTTVSTVIELANVSRGMVRHEFGSKQQMLVQTMQSLCSEWTASTEPDEALEPEDQVLSIVRAMFATDVFTPAQVDAWLALSIEAASNNELRDVREQAYERWRDQLLSAFMRTNVSDARRAADGVLALADGLWLRHRLEPSAMPRVEAERTAVEVAQVLLNSGGAAD